MKPSVSYLKLTRLSASLIGEAIPHAIATCEEGNYEEWCEAPDSKTTATTATLSLDMWERIAEDCQMVSGDYQTGNRSLWDSNCDLSEGFVDSGDARLAKAWAKQATDIQRAVDNALAGGARLQDGTNEPCNR